MTPLLGPKKGVENTCFLPAERSLAGKSGPKKKVEIGFFVPWKSIFNPSAVSTSGNLSDKIPRNGILTPWLPFLRGVDIKVDFFDRFLAFFGAPR